MVLYLGGKAQLSMIISVTNQVIHLLTRRPILTVRYKGIPFLVYWYWTYSKVKNEFNKRLEIFLACINQKLKTCKILPRVDFVPNFFLSLLNINKIQQIPDLCRFIKIGLFALSTNTVHSNVTPAVSWVRIKAPTERCYTMTMSISREETLLWLSVTIHVIY